MYSPRIHGLWSLFQHEDHQSQAGVAQQTHTTQSQRHNRTRKKMEQEQRLGAEAAQPELELREVDEMQHPVESARTTFEYLEGLKSPHES